MANTIKLGAGNWATKENEILAYNDENNNFKPLPFDTTRATTATRVNKDGLIENIAASVPRVDYASGDGALLLEPASTNLITESEAFGNSYWTKSGASIEPSSTRITGINLLDGYDFTTWNTYFSPTSVTSNSFTSDATKDGVSKDGVIVGSKSYELLITGDTTATSLNVRSNSGEDIKNLTGTFSETIRFQWVDSTDTDFTLSNVGVGTTTITSLQLYEVQGFSAPSVDSPLGAFKLVESTTTAIHEILTSNFSITAGVNYAISIIAKKGEKEFLQLTLGGASSQAYVNFNLTLGTVSSSGNSPFSTDIIELGNGYYRCVLVATSTVSTGSGNAVVGVLDVGTSVRRSGTYTGDGTSGVYIFASQIEAQSSATSYIPTAGTIISRTAESASRSGLSSLINSSEGVLYFEGSALVDGGSDRTISLSDGTQNNALQLIYHATSKRVNFRWKVGNSIIVNISDFTYFQTDNLKIALKFSLNDFSLWINGIERAVSSSGAILPFNTLNELNFNDFEGNCKDLRVYDQILTDAELQTLTTI